MEESSMSEYFNFKELKESILEDLDEYVRTKDKLNSIWNDIESYMIPLYEKVCRRLPQGEYNSCYDVWECSDEGYNNGLFVDVTTTSEDDSFEHTNSIQINIKLDLTSGILVFTSHQYSNPYRCRAAFKDVSRELRIDYDNHDDLSDFHEECVAMVGATVAEYIKETN